MTRHFLKSPILLFSRKWKYHDTEIVTTFKFVLFFCISSVYMNVSVSAIGHSLVWAAVPPKEMSCIIISSMGPPSAARARHLSSLSTWGNKDFPRPKANIAMMTKVRGAKRERWDKMSFPSDWFSYSSNYVAAIWPWLQLWVAFHDMYTWGLEELFWCFLETKLGRRFQKIWKSLFSSVLSKAFCESFWGQSLVTISKKTYSSLFLGYGKGKGQVWGLEPTEFPIYQPITFFFLL